MAGISRILAGIMLLAATAVQAQTPEEEAAQVAAEYRAAHEREILTEFFDLLRFPNYAGNPEDIRQNAEHLTEMLGRRGIKARILDTGVGSPAVYGERITEGAETTVLFYIHYDGQPVVPENWNTDPYDPVIKTGYEARGGRVIPFADLDFPLDPDLRVFARSASDDKAPVIAFLTALDALDAAGIAPAVNIKLFLEGEEEGGSPHLSKTLDQYGDLLSADLMLFLDGPVHQSGRKKLSFGVRGITGYDLTVYGPDRPLHSGHYGNFAPNPIAMLAHLIASMRDENGRVPIEGFYDNVVPPTETEKAAIVAMPDIGDQLMEELAIGRQESPGMRYQEAILWPALNAKGIRAGEVGSAARNAIVPSATAAIGYRLVPAQDPARLKRLTVAHLEAQGYHVVEDEPDAATRRAHPKVARIRWNDFAYASVRTPMDAPSSQAVINVMRDLGHDPVLIPSSGGSLPIWYFTQALETPVIMLPIANYDNNQHAENENIRLGNLWDGIEIYAGLLVGVGNVSAD